MKKAVHFGAGNIGRGFIGLLLAQSGYEVVFVDINEEIISKMNEEKGYKVIIAGKDNEEIQVKGISGILSSDEDSVITAITESEVITTAVGVNILPIIAKSITKGIQKMSTLGLKKKVNILACENAVNNTGILKNAILEDMDEELKNYTLAHFGFPNTTVDRIVPETAKGEDEDVLSVMVEPFFEWNAERSGFAGEIPKIEGMNLVDNLPAYIERKLFTLNTAHAVTAYLGYAKGFKYIHEAIKDDEIRSTIKGIMAEVGDALVEKHGFDAEEHRKYTEKIIKRFDNAVLMDPVERVGRDPLRKLNPKDRLIAPARLVVEQGNVPANLLKGIVAALRFDNSDDSKSKALSSMLEEYGLSHVLTEVCGLNKDETLFRLITEEYEK